MTDNACIRFAFVFSPAGRLSPQPFIIAAILVYIAGVASHGLTRRTSSGAPAYGRSSPPRSCSIWIWYALHAKRLRDGGQSTGLAAGVSLLYALSVALLVIVAASFYGALCRQTAPTRIPPVRSV